MIVESSFGGMAPELHRAFLITIIMDLTNKVVHERDALQRDFATHAISSVGSESLVSKMSSAVQSSMRMVLDARLSSFKNGGL